MEQRTKKNGFLHLNRATSRSSVCHLSTGKGRICPVGGPIAHPSTKNCPLASVMSSFCLFFFAFIATSSILLISVPLVFASPDVWSSKKNLVFYGTSFLIG